MFRFVQKAKKRLSPGAKRKISEYIRSQQIDNGLFTDRSHLTVDTYYSVFGLMLARIFGLDVDKKQAVNQLYSSKVNQYDLTSLSSYIRTAQLLSLNVNKLDAAWKPKTVEDLILTSFPNGDPSSPYSQFLLWSLKEDLRYKVIDKAYILNLLDYYRTAEGGFSNMQGGACMSTNATVAALLLKGQIKKYTSDNNADILTKMQVNSGGFKASEIAPIPDLLSTATALFVLSCYKLTPRISATDFVEAHWNANGGFSGNVADENTDIEYTFYGLLALGI